MPQIETDDGTSASVFADAPAAQYLYFSVDGDCIPPESPWHGQGAPTREAFLADWRAEDPKSRAKLPDSECPPTPATGDVTIGLKALSPEEEIEAAKRTNGDGVRLPYEMVKMALRRIGEPGSRQTRDVRRDEFEHVAIWDRLGPRGRNVVMAAYQEMASAGKEPIAKMRRSFRWGA